MLTIIRSSLLFDSDLPLLIHIFDGISRAHVLEIRRYQSSVVQASKEGLDDFEDHE